MKFENTVKVNKEFQIALPAGKHSFDQEEIGSERCMVFISEQTNNYYMDHCGEESLKMTSLMSPFTAPKCLVINNAVPIAAVRQFAMMSILGVPVELKNGTVREGLKNLLTGLWTSLGFTANQVFLQNDSKLLVGYATDNYSSYMIGIAAGKSLYIGQLWINDEEDIKEAEKQTAEWLNTVEPLTKSGKVAAKKKPENKLYIGSWPQTEESSFDPIEWLILKEEEDRMMVITKDIIIFKPVYESEKYSPHLQDDDPIQLHRHEIMRENPEYYTWKGGTLRTWLNTEFYEKAFAAEEKERIQTTRYTGEVKQGKELLPTEELEDKIYILSSGEASEFYQKNPKRKAKWSAVVRAKATASYVAYWGEGYGDWWLRTDCGSGLVANVYETGRIDNRYADAIIGVRPVMWIKK